MTAAYRSPSAAFSPRSEPDASPLRAPTRTSEI